MCSIGDSDLMWERESIILLCCFSLRLKLDSFTDKDSAIQNLECGDDDDDEGDFVGRQPTNVLVEMEKNKTSKVYEDPLSSSQSSGNELSGSQPQPFAAQAIMEEDDDDDDELNIEEYNSDWILENGNPNAAILLNIENSV